MNQALRLPASQPENRDGSGRDNGRFWVFWLAPTRAGRMARIPRGAGPASKGKGPETFRALVIGGG